MNWSDLASLAAFATFVSAVGFWAARGRFSAVFVSKNDFEEHKARLAEVERQIKATPTHEDFRRLTEALGSMTRDVAVVIERVGGLKEGFVRVEREIGLLVQARLEWEKSQ